MEVKILQVRRAQRVSLRELEEKTGIGKSTLNNLEIGKTVPRLDQLEKIAAALNVGIIDLFSSPFMTKDC